MHIVDVLRNVMKGSVYIAVTMTSLLTIYVVIALVFGIGQIGELRDALSGSIDSIVAFEAQMSEGLGFKDADGNIISIEDLQKSAEEGKTTIEDLGSGK